MEKAKANQEELVAKCGSLIHEIESIEGLLPPSALDEYTDKINVYYNRIEALHTRVAALNRRADNLLRKLGTTKNEPRKIALTRLRSLLFRGNNCDKG
jgi:hypothetical protein